MVILGIETSCDDSAAGVWRDGRIIANVVNTQKIHSRWGGVVPELASRDHIRTIIPTIRSALVSAEIELKDLDGIAVCAGPGLLGSLLVGLCTGKAMAWELGVPLAGVHHLEGHLFAALFDKKIETPLVALIVSGGHSHTYFVPEPGRYELLGKTRDDAAGEAFDKGAVAMGLTYPGGPAIEEAAVDGDPEAFDFPRAMRVRGELDMSFSGLKTALVNTVAQLDSKRSERTPADLAASYQEAIVDTLLFKVGEAAKACSTKRIAVVGGVASNARFREKLFERAGKEGWIVHFPPEDLCTDNGAMIAAAGAFRIERGDIADWNITAVSRWPLETVNS